MRWVLFIVLVCFPCCLYAQGNPFSGPDQFPEFRDLAGLAGSMYGADAKGYPSLSGPTAFSTPVAHVLGHGHAHIAGGAHNKTLDLDAGNLFGTFYGTYGHSFGEMNVAVSIKVLSEALNFVVNAQAQYAPKRESRLIGSFGVQDWRGHGGAAGDGTPGDTRSSRSFFGVATYRIDTGKAPLYLSGGIGTRRFKRPFGSASYQVANPVRLWVEDDGFGWNTGLLFTWMPYKESKTDIAEHREKKTEFNLLFGVLKGRFLTAGIGFGF